ncbi:MAG: response regulator, partial [Longimicrobiales bacterium]|nr:response regulator [Longimicrobiales bacterium]
MSSTSTESPESITIEGRPARVMVVDDDADHLRVVCDQLEHTGFDVTGVEDAEQALARISKVEPDLVVTDVRMPGMDGFQLLEKVRSATEDVDVIVMTGHEDMSSAVAAMKGGAFDYLVKPIRMAELTDRLEACIAEKKLRKQLEKEAAAVEDVRDEGEGTLLVGRDPRMIEIYKIIGVLARNRATVLIRGETGTG